ncbi:MAG: GNAT family N-acetyltransferase [Candidatus Eremiobacteraeota bacterium]|nr:GNAT family N-acetyltransferase [Candidatus Eremiobacteraeota bacterium]MBV9737961.1 GNAT family N-acetyltransferase [Candidatus Eremiobacteraeota bacterium]
MTANHTKLLEATDSHFEDMLHGADMIGAYRLPPGGVDDRVVLENVRRITRTLNAAGCRASWLIVEDGEVVGLCGYRRPPKDGEVEIGYSVALTRRNRGIATRAVAAIVAAARLDPQIHKITADTAENNPASGAVLKKNGFVEAGRGNDPDDGPAVYWVLQTSSTRR